MIATDFRKCFFGERQDSLQWSCLKLKVGESVGRLRRTRDFQAKLPKVLGMDVPEKGPEGLILLEKVLHSPL
jgi:hypothetical protein